MIDPLVLKALDDFYYQVEQAKLWIEELQSMETLPQDRCLCDTCEGRGVK